MRAALQLQLSGLAALLLSASLLFLKLDILKLSVSSTCDRDVGIQVTQLNNPSFFVSGDFFADAKSLRTRQKSLPCLANEKG